MKHRPLAFALVALAACATDPTASSLRGLTTSLSEGLTLSVTATPARLVLGDSARFEVALTNHADTAVTLHFPSGCQLHYVVEDAEGGAVPDEGGGHGCTQALTTLHLPAGATHRREFTWSHTRYTSSPYAKSYRRPGAYRVVPTITGRADGVETDRGTPASFEVIDTATYGAKPEVAIAVEPARTRVRTGDTLSVFVLFENLGAETVQMRFTSTCQYRLAFYASAQSSAETPASVLGDACGDALTSLTLAVGETRVERAVWRAVGQDGAPLPVDGYRVVGTLGAHAPERKIDAPLKFIRVDP